MARIVVSCGVFCQNCPVLVNVSDLCAPNLSATSYPVKGELARSAVTSRRRPLPRRPGIRSWSSRTGWRGPIALALERRRHRDSVRGRRLMNALSGRETQGWPQRRRRAGGDAACCPRSRRSGTQVELSWIWLISRRNLTRPVTYRQALVTHVRALPDQPPPEASLLPPRRGFGPGPPSRRGTALAPRGGAALAPERTARWRSGW